MNGIIASAGGRAPLRVKNADTLRRISFARFLSRLSRSDSLSRSRSLLVNPLRRQ